MSKLFRQPRKNIGRSNSSDMSEEVKMNIRCKLKLLPLSLIMLLFVVLLGTKVDAASRDGICQSKDVRHTPSELMTLKNCRVIEGFLMINLMERFNDSEYDNLTFPDLVEITDFLMFFRVQGLKSLSYLFPNLRVIRGNNLINDYALIIYEMPHLQEIGLQSLTTIVRGGVRIEKNPLLCFVDTINWLYIARGTEIEDHFINSNKNINECPVCPTTCMKYAASKVDPHKAHCWNRQHCQKICPDSCGRRSCDVYGTCCDDSCLGSCEPTDPKNCSVCRSLSIGPLTNRECIEECPENLYVFQQRRCLSQIQCRYVSQPFVMPVESLPKNPFIPFNGTCATTCPKGYLPEGPSAGRFCKPCNGECKRECDGSTIYSIAAAQSYRGCTIITGSLLIHIRQSGLNVIKELEHSLSDIEEIEGGLNVIQSYSIVSLNFFKKLKVIHGMNVPNNYTLYVMNNQNLQSLFDRKVNIERGKIFVHFNSKLCYSKIEKLKDDIHDLKDFKKLFVEDVSPDTNGDKVACNVKKLFARPSSIMNIGAIIDVETIKYEDSRVLMGYVLHYKPAPYQNVSMYDSRNACGGDGWHVEDSTEFDRKAPIVQIVLPNLKPYTQYAYYVKTKTIASEPFGGQTDILYFRTLPGRPGIVQNMKVLTNGSSSIIVTWEPPKATNGQLTNYIVKASLIYDDPEILQQRNYCTDSLQKEDFKTLVQPQIHSKPLTNIGLEDRDSEEDTRDNYPSKESEIEQSINFENEIHNIVYINRRISMTTGTDGRYRRRRNVATSTINKNQREKSRWIDESEYVIYDDFLSTQRAVEIEDSTNKMVNGYYENFYDDEVNASIHSYDFNNLRHFSVYMITVQACRDNDDAAFNVRNFCSDYVQEILRTSEIDDADDIKFLIKTEVSNSNSGMGAVKLIWPEPEDPNGLIVSYTIIYRRVDLKNIQPIEQCITSPQYVNLSGEISLLELPNGDYSISVRATSLAGDGKLTSSIFISINKTFDLLSLHYFQIIGASIAIIVVVCLLCFTYFKCCRS